MDAATQMAADGLQAFGMIGTVLWTMLRIGAVAGTLAIALAPLLPPVPDWTGFDAATVLTIARELAIGVSIGFLLRLVFEAGGVGRGNGPAGPAPVRCRLPGCGRGHTLTRSSRFAACPSPGSAR